MEPDARPLRAGCNEESRATMILTPGKSLPFVAFFWLYHQPHKRLRQSTANTATPIPRRANG
jgi:hypothetical protein